MGSKGLNFVQKGSKLTKIPKPQTTTEMSNKFHSFSKTPAAATSRQRPFPRSYFTEPKIPKMGSPTMGVVFRRNDINMMTI